MEMGKQMLFLTSVMCISDCAKRQICNEAGTERTEEFIYRGVYNNSVTVFWFHRVSKTFKVLLTEHNLSTAAYLFIQSKLNER